MGGRNEKLYNFEHLQHHKPVQLGATATDYCILDFGLAGMTSQRTIPKIWMDNKCKWSVSTSLVIFHDKFFVKLEIRGFYESSHSSAAKGQSLAQTSTFKLQKCLLASSFTWMAKARCQI